MILTKVAWRTTKIGLMTTTQKVNRVMETRTAKATML